MGKVYRSCEGVQNLDHCFDQLKLEISDIMVENIEKRFDSFQSELRKYALESGHAQVEELTEMKRENEALEVKTVLLDQQVRTLQASMSLIRNTEIMSKPVNETTENFLGFDSIGQNVEVLKEVFSHIIETVEGEFMSDLIPKSLVDVNNNSDFKGRKNPKKSQKGKEQVETRLTRSKRKASGGFLVNPRKFYPCLICGEKKHMDYSPHQLKNHYRDSHGYQLGTGPLPITISQLEEKPAIGSQQSTTKCHICDTNFKELETLFLHKSLHVNPKFCRYKCSKETCKEAFVLKVQLQNHEKVYYHDHMGSE